MGEGTDPLGELWSRSRQSPPLSRGELPAPGADADSTVDLVLLAVIDIDGIEGLVSGATLIADCADELATTDGRWAASSTTGHRRRVRSSARAAAVDVKAMS
jgi:hypothetical protein